MENNGTITLLIRGIPGDVHEVLKKRAERTYTSVTGVVLNILDEATKDKREGVKPC